MDNLAKTIFDDINKTNKFLREVYFGITPEEVVQALIEKGDVKEEEEDGGERNSNG